ncbi:hypothetical protein Gpo141_00009877 [Globisporangium polare]
MRSAGGAQSTSGAATGAPVTGAVGVPASGAAVANPTASASISTITATPTATVQIDQRKWNMERLKVSYFDGRTRSVYDWINHFESTVEADEGTLGGERWPSAILYYKMASCFLDEASTWYAWNKHSIPESERTVEALKERLRIQYGGWCSAAKVLTDVMTWEKRDNETFSEYAGALTKIGEGSTLVEPQYIKAFTNGVAARIRSSLATAKPRTHAEAVERSCIISLSDGATMPHPPSFYRAATSAATTDEVMVAQCAGERGKPSQVHKRGNHKGPPEKREEVNQLNESAVQNRKRKRECFNCKALGHWRECPQPNKRARQLESPAEN